MNHIKKFNEVLNAGDNKEDIKSLEESINFLKKMYNSIIKTGGIDNMQLNFIKELKSLCTEYN